MDVTNWFIVENMKANIIEFEGERGVMLEVVGHYPAQPTVVQALVFDKEDFMRLSTFAIEVETHAEFI